MTGSKNRQLQASVLPVLYKDGFIEEHGIDITDFAKEFSSRNRKQGYAITRHDVEWYWEGNIRVEFDTVDPIHNRLISQIKSPKFETFWMNSTAGMALQARRASQEQESFWLLRPKSKEKKHFGGALILGNREERWIIPKVSLMAMDDISFPEFVQDIRGANTGRAGVHLDGSKVFRLWGALIKKAYNFMPKEVQDEKLKEAFSRHPPTTEAGLEEFFAAPSKKRISPRSPEGDAVDRDHSRGSRKRRCVSIGEFHIQEFDSESVLDPTLQPILKGAHKNVPNAIAGSSTSASPQSWTNANSNKSGEDTVELALKKIEALEKELAKSKAAKDEIEHRTRSEEGRRRAAERTIESLQVDLQESRDLVVQLSPTKHL